MIRPALALAAGSLAVLGLAACSSSTPTISAQSGPTATAASTAATTAAATTAAAPTSAPTAAASVAPIGSGALPGVPAVTANATELLKQPTVAAGTGTAPTGLVTRDIALGTGTTATSLSDSVVVHYTGSLYSNGKVFDASWTDGATNGEAPFGLSQVVPGFGEGIIGMKVGGRREIVIPPALGYGPSGGQPQAGISATDTLVFVVDLDKVTPAG